MSVRHPSAPGLLTRRRVLSTLTLSLGVLTLGCIGGTSTPPRPAGEPAPIVRSTDATNGMVVSASAIASEAGAQVLAAGGNAVDAAIATGFALAVTYPGAGNIGGGGFMVVRLANGSATTIDYRERAPGGASETMYLDGTGAIDRSLTREGYLAPGVPGTVRGLALAHRRFGKLPWRVVVKPAADLARNGFALSSSLAGELNWLVKSTHDKYPATTRAYGKPGGDEWRAGDMLVLPDLARALDAIASDGPDAFYRGWIADSIAAAMRSGGGLITRKDLADYKAVERAPVRGSFLGHEIIGMPPPSSGGTAIIEMLNILERFDIGRRERFAPTTLHLMIEAQRRAYLDRAEFLGDADFGDVPVARLISADHAARLAASIDTTRSSSSIALAQGRIVVAPAPESEETTHFSVVDAIGNGRRQHLHPRGRVRVAGGRIGCRLPAQQRDGRLQQEGRAHEHDR